MTDFAPSITPSYDHQDEMARAQVLRGFVFLKTALYRHGQTMLETEEILSGSSRFEPMSDQQDDVELHGQLQEAIDTSEEQSAIRTRRLDEVRRLEAAFQSGDRVSGGEVEAAAMLFHTMVTRTAMEWYESVATAQAIKKVQDPIELERLTVTLYGYLGALRAVSDVGLMCPFWPPFDDVAL